MPLKSGAKVLKIFDICKYILLFARDYTHNNTAAIKNMPTIQIVSITKLTIDLSIVVPFLIYAAKVQHESVTT